MTTRRNSLLSRRSLLRGAGIGGLGLGLGLPFLSSLMARAGGVDTGHSQFEVDGRTVYRSTCAGGVTMYHVRLESPDRVVSVQGVGEADIGRAIVEGLAE